MTTSDNPSNDKVSTADRDTAAASPTKGRRFNVFSNLNIGVRLGLGFGLLVVMIIIFAGVTLYTTQLQDVALEEFRVAEEETFLIEQLDIELLKARLLEEKFELRHEVEGFELAFANYILPNQQHTQKMRVLADEARANLTGETERDLRDIADLEQIVLDIDEYEATIVDLAANIEARGDSTSGLEGRIIADLDELDRTLDEAGELAVEVLGFAVLKEFLEYNIDRGPNHAEAFKTGMVTLISAIQNDGALSQTEKTTLLAEAEDASTAFDALLLIDAEISAEEEILEADGLDIERLSEEIIADERAVEAEAFAEFKNIEQLAQSLDVGIAATAILLGSIVAVIVTRSITGPVTRLTAVAEKVSTGDINVEAHIESGDELGILAVAFNRMTAQLRASIDTLEERVATRTQLLETSTEVSRGLATILDREQLLLQVVEKVREAFDYYHAHVYTFDEASNMLTMAGGTGDAGAEMLSRGHTIEAGKGLVGRAAATNSVVLEPDTSKAEGWLPNPLLPETKAEIAVPIAAGDKVLGVLDVQHNIVNGLGKQDGDLLKSVASQVAVALQNAEFYAQSQKRADREALANAIGQKIDSATTVENALQIAAREVGRALGAKRTLVELNPSDA